MKVVNGSWRSFEDVPAVVVVVDVDPACAGEVADLTEVCLRLFVLWPTVAVWQMMTSACALFPLSLFCLRLATGRLNGSNRN